MAEKQQDKNAEQRERLIEIAAEKMRRYGIKSISVDDLCHELGMSKKTFYVCFSNKDELIRDLLRRHECQLERRAEEQTRGKSVMTLLINFMSLAMKTKDVRTNPPLFYDLRKYYPQLFDEHLEHVREMTKRLLCSYLQRGVDEGVFRAELDVTRTAAIMAYLHHEMLNLSPQITENYYDQVVSHIRYAVDIFMRGIISDEGRARIEEQLRKRNRK